MLCQVIELGLCATGFASAGRQYTTLMYTGTTSGTPKLSTESALGRNVRGGWRWVLSIDIDRMVGTCRIAPIKDPQGAL